MAASVIVFTFLSLICVQFCSAYPLFWNGRPRGGMVGAPVRTLSGLLPPDQWVTQRLDHFDDANLQSWQQVKINK